MGTIQTAQLVDQISSKQIYFYNCKQPHIKNCHYSVIRYSGDVFGWTKTDEYGYFSIGRLIFPKGWRYFYKYYTREGGKKMEGAERWSHNLKILVICVWSILKFFFMKHVWKRRALLFGTFVTIFLEVNKWWRNVSVKWVGKFVRNYFDLIG